MGAMAEMFVAVWDEWGERMDTMGWLYYWNLVGLKDTREEREI